MAIFKNKNKGFSLVELIVVIAILVVFAAVLIPSLLQYTENSRAQKDVSAMDEVVNAFQLAMADAECFDEMLQYSCKNNYLTYSDSSGNYGQQINDGEYWAPDGAGRATTITFNPEVDVSGKVVYRLDSAIVNDMTYGNGSVAQSRVMEGSMVENNQCYLKNAKSSTASAGSVYSTVRQSVGDSLDNTSQTYRNSSFTVFIKFTQKDGVTVADVYGQFNGTNVHDGASASKGSGTESYDDITNEAEGNLGGGTIGAVFTQTDLHGTGNFGSQDYKSKDNFEILDKDYEFKFYSSVKLAADDINSGNIGSLADLEDKENAEAGIYIDNNSLPTILLLKNSFTTATIQLNVDAGIDLNGYTLTSKASIGIKAANNLNLIGNGGKIFAKHDNINQAVRLVSVGGTLNINGGTYELDNQTSLSSTIGLIASKTIMRDANIKIIGGLYGYTYGIYQNEICAYNSNVGTYNPHSREATNYVYKCYAVIDNKSANGYSELINCNVYSSCYTVTGYFDKFVGGTYSSPMNNIFLNGTNGGKNIIFKDVTFKDEIMWRSQDTKFHWYADQNVLAFGGSNKFANYDIYIIDCFFNTPNMKSVSIRLQGANGENNCNMYLSGNRFNVECKGTRPTQFISSFGASAGHNVYCGADNKFFDDLLIANNFYHQDTLHMTNETYEAP